MEELILLHDMYINDLITREEVFTKLKAIFNSDRAVETILKKWEGENDKQKKLETINMLVKTIENIDSIFTYGKRELYVLHYNNGNMSDISAETIDNALSAYKETLTMKLKQLGYEENYVEVTTRG